MRAATLPASPPLFEPRAMTTLHVSGCSKSCAHRGRASLTLVGRDGRYDLIRNGSAADRPSLTGLTVDQIEALLQSAKGQRP